MAAAAVLLALTVWLWAFGGAQEVARWAVEGQREAQGALARALRALRAGEPGALATLWGMCFAYGVFHAAGPGHGKILLGGYGVARQVAAVRLAGLALAASLAQAGTAVALVAAGWLLLGWSRTRLTDTAETVLAPLSHAAIAAIGLWLIFRGARRLWLRTRRTGGLPSSHDHEAEGTCASCGHRHGPTAQEAARVRGLRDAVMLIAAVAVRPCSGALLLLVLTWGMGLYWQGVGGAVAMGLGTAVITTGAALAGALFRRGALASGGGMSLWLAGALELVAGAVIVAISGQLLGIPL
ncbi:ABC-type nickel/cobalt efflux system, permease component RcnA [Salinihabitans flavidus]|uniref:Nickel/cobalt efflux system n=2 Tax=Salinihabitans flavidus TaxID=569882 RepID=A0A1H8V446_9RHOB|nr:ABC-type nickel/cobalt efflux system, permease component RcnA [Salinihabitans flavidus]